jgi:hypothetical protein
VVDDSEWQKIVDETTKRVEALEKQKHADPK